MATKFAIRTALGTAALVAFAGTLVTPSARASIEKDQARVQLEKELALIRRIEHHVERSDLPRLYLLRKATERVLASIAANGMGHTQTMREFQNFVITYQYSGDLFRQIRSQRTQDAITEISTIADTIAHDRGLDDTPFTQVTADVFYQIHEVLETLTQMQLAPELKDQLVALKAPIGRLVALAKTGDRPKTFDAAAPVYASIRALYPALAKISASNAAFEAILNLQGLAEFYATFAGYGYGAGGAP